MPKKWKCRWCPSEQPPPLLTLGNDAVVATTFPECPMSNLLITVFLYSWKKLIISAAPVHATSRPTFGARIQQPCKKQNGRRLESFA
mmetsp:Transcript_12187/g.17777  ORF Transcript_12187/g.17777 Transcript_12187/m.17777 type:complete len:87 (+) Transcript_12187:2527-2787(+)